MRAPVCMRKGELAVLGGLARGERTAWRLGWSPLLFSLEHWKERAGIQKRFGSTSMAPYTLLDRFPFFIFTSCYVNLLLNSH